MTAISFIAPYAPQPVAPASAEPKFAASSLTVPVSDTKPGGDAGLASDQSGQGAGNGTGTGGAQLAVLLNRNRADPTIERAAPRSVVEAQSDSDPATEFLARQAQARNDAKAQRAELDLRRAEERAAREDKENAEQLRPEFKPPNPIPTAPILQNEDT